MSSQAPVVLIVDDLGENRRLYGNTLLDLDCTLLTASSGEEALQLAEQHDLAVVLLDVQMPGLDGFEVARRLRAPERLSHPPILFVSAVYTDLTSIFRGYKIGAIDYLVAPVPTEILRAKVCAFIDLYRVRHEAQAQTVRVEHLNRELSVAYAGLETFSYAAAHDLRAPLIRIGHMSQMLLEDYGHLLDDDGRHLAGRVVANAHTLLNLIACLLELAKITRTPLHRDTCDLSSLAHVLSQEFAASAPERAVTWDITPNLVAQGEPTLLRSLLANLIDNAWKYTAKTPGARIEIGRATQAGETLFYVRDNGLGFDAAQAGEHLFKPFCRFHSSSEFSGNGIGLATVKHIVTKHNGRVWAESHPGHGAIFWFTLAPPGTADA